MRDFHNLQVWQKSHQLALQVYELTKSFLSSELYGLTNQLRRAAVSVASNIAEGCGRTSENDFGRFLQMALGSANEIEHQLLLAKDLGYLSTDSWQATHGQINEVRRMLIAFIQTLRVS